MTPSQKLRVAVCRELGWSGPKLTLELMYEAEETLSTKDRREYIHALWDQVRNDADDASWYLESWVFVRATAEQRAVAFLKAKGIEL